MLKELLDKLPKQKGGKATPEEELAFYRYFEKLMPFYSKSMICAKVMSVLFYTWAILGFFSVQIIYEFSLVRITNLSMICSAPYLFCSWGAIEAKGFLSRMVYFPSDDREKLLKRYHKMRVESILLGVPHGIIAIVSIVLRFKL
jgi:hypothetical protein